MAEQVISKGEIRPIGSLRLWDKNPRGIKETRFTELKTRLQRQGQIKPLLVTQDGVVIGGNMRLRAMQDLGYTDVWVSVQKANTDKEIFDLALTDNEEFGYYEEQQLAELAVSLGLTPLELQSYEISLGKPTTLDLLLDKFGPEIEEDEVPEVDTDNEPESRLGEIYQLGNHRLMCGDSTDIDAVRELLNGRRPELLFTDPPYRMEAEGGSNQWVGKQASKLGETIKDIVDFEPEAFLQVIKDIFSPRMNAYIFCNKDLVPDYLNWAKNCGFGFNILVWKKPNALPLGGSHRPDLEYIIKVHKSATWNNGIMGVNYSKCLEYSRDNSENHPTIKPLGLIINELKVSSSREGLVLDLFLGSGSTVIACELTSRICYGMELDPRYCDVIRKRYANHIGEGDTWQEATPAIQSGVLV